MGRGKAAPTINMQKFYITTTLPYVNAEPHLGFALEMIYADIIARRQRLLGKEVFFNTGTDEHGLKIYRKAVEQGKDPQDYVDEYAAKFDKLKDALNLSYTNFIRTTDDKHEAAAREFWKLCEKAGDIYKKPYKIKYCVGCELEKTESELENGKCPIHPNLKLETIEEENYFFKFSKYGKPLLDFYKKRHDFVVPDFRFNEIKQFIKSGLRDFSISRLKEKMPWGVPVPNDSTHVMYVWFDALVNYISTLGWPKNKKRFKDFWPGVQIAGKDNLRQQSAMWQAMLMSAGLPNSKQIIIHGFITSGGQKMSKSLGNVADPYKILEKLKEAGLAAGQSTDALRYYLSREISPFEDGDYTEEHFKKTYNAGLANGLGNLVSRVFTLAEKYLDKMPKEKKYLADFWKMYDSAMDGYKLNVAMDLIWGEISKCDIIVDKEKPWELAGTQKHGNKKTKKQEEEDKKKLREVLNDLLERLRQIGLALRPFLPETAEKILNKFEGAKPKKGEPLFPRLEK